MSEMYRTTSLPVAAFFIAARHLQLQDLDLDPVRNDVTFVFSDPKAQDERLEREFLTQNALVPGAEFHRQLRVLRRLIDDKQNFKNQTNRGNNYGYAKRF